MAAARDLLREARRRRGWSQTRLAREAGVPNTRISEWESGLHDPSVQRLTTLLTVMGFTLELRELPGPTGD